MGQTASAQAEVRMTVDRMAILHVVLARYSASALGAEHWRGCPLRVACEPHHPLPVGARATVGSCAKCAKTMPRRLKRTPSEDVACTIPELERRFDPQLAAISEAHIWYGGGVTVSSKSTAPPQLDTFAPRSSIIRSPASVVVSSRASVWQRSPVHSTSHLHTWCDGRAAIEAAVTTVAQRSGGQRLGRPGAINRTDNTRWRRRRRHTWAAAR